MHLAVDSHGMPVRLILTEGTSADCSEALALIEDIEAEHLLADKGYDSFVICNFSYWKEIQNGTLRLPRL